MELRKTEAMILHERQKRRHRCKEQTFGIMRPWAADSWWWGAVPIPQCVTHALSQPP